MTYAVLQVKWQGLRYLIDLQIIVLTRQKDNVGLTTGVYYYGRCITVHGRIGSVFAERSSQGAHANLCLFLHKYHSPLTNKNITFSTEE